MDQISHFRTKEAAMSTTTVRDATLEDAGRILEIYSYYVQETAISFEYDVPTLSQFQERMRKTMERYPYLVAGSRAMPMRAPSWAGPPTTGPAS